MQAPTLDLRARRAAKAAELRRECRRYGAHPADVDGLGLEGLFDLRWRLLHGLMAAPSGR